MLACVFLKSSHIVARGLTHELALDACATVAHFRYAKCVYEYN